MTKIFNKSDNFFFHKNTFKVALQYLFNLFILFNIVFNLKLNFKLKIDPIAYFLKPGKNFEKMSDNPEKKPIKLY